MKSSTLFALLVLTAVALLAGYYYTSNRSGSGFACQSALCGENNNCGATTTPAEKTTEPEMAPENMMLETEEVATSIDAEHVQVQVESFIEAPINQEEKKLVKQIAEYSGTCQPPYPL